MVVTLSLIVPETVTREYLFARVRQARQIALENEEVYDLALYQSEEPRLWQCSVELKNTGEWESLQQESHFRQIWNELRERGVHVLTEHRLERWV